jgi:hypothetical protein
MALSNQGETMNRLLKVSIIVAALEAASSSVTFAATVFVSKGGQDIGTCNPSPCLTINYAYSQALAGGDTAHIIFISDGNWQENVNLNVPGRSVEFTTSNDVFAKINPTSGSAAVSVNLGTTDTVRFEKMRLGGHAGTGAANGILFQAGQNLQITETEIIEFANAGVNFGPANAAKLFIFDSLIAGNGKSGTASGINIKPSSGIEADVVIDHTRFRNNLFGIIADGNSGGIVRGAVRDSVVAASDNNGITASSSGSGSAVLLIEKTTISGNAIGLAVAGAGAGMLVGESSIAFNNTGLFTGSGAVLISYKNNNLNGNATSDGAFTGFVTQQ